VERKIILVLLVFLVINVAVLDGFKILDLNKDNTVVLENSDVSEENSEIESRVNQLENQIAGLVVSDEVVETEPKITTVVQVQKEESAKTSHVSYVNISGGFGQVAYDWVDVPASQFYFNKADYTGLQQIKFESNMRLVNGNGKAFVRLFDETNGVAVTGSQVETGNQDDTIVVSEAINFMSGNNLIKVQIKSLTADTTYFNSGRLVITEEY